MEKFENLKDKLYKYRYPSIYIILFIVCTLYFNSIILFLVSSVILTIILFYIHKDFVKTTLAIGNHNSGKLELAEKSFKELIEKNTKIATCYAYYGNVVLLEGKPDEAIPIIQKGLTLKCDSIVHKNLTLTLSSCYWVKGDYKKSIHLLEGLKEKYKYLNHHVLATLGYLYLLDENIELAIENTKLALEDDSTSHSALDNMGQIKFKLGEFEEAKTYFNKALDYKHNLVDSLYYLGLIYIDENTEESLSKAYELLEKASVSPCSVLNTVTLEMINEKLELVKKLIEN